jgi:hypothetical protein
MALRPTIALQTPQTFVGASLLAKAVPQLTKMPNVLASSRAGSLPQWDWNKAKETGRL